VVVAFTLTSASGTSMIWARRVCMAARCGPILGASQMIVTSTLPIW
jgi:hypothetical protein